MASQDYYAVLGLNSSCTQKELTVAYRRLALLQHPDKNRGDANATAKFQLLGNAYHTLRDEEKRRAYDKTQNQFQFKADERNSSHNNFRRPTAPPKGEYMSDLREKKANLTSLLKKLCDDNLRLKEIWAQSLNGVIPEEYQNHQAFGGEAHEVMEAIFNDLNSKYLDLIRKRDVALGAYHTVMAEIQRLKHSR